MRNYYSTKALESTYKYTGGLHISADGRTAWGHIAGRGNDKYELVPSPDPNNTDLIWHWYDGDPVPGQTWTDNWNHFTHDFEEGWNNFFNPPGMYGNSGSFTGGAAGFGGGGNSGNSGSSGGFGGGSNHGADMQSSMQSAEGATTPQRRYDPLILDLDGDGIETTSIQNGTFFDLDKNGFAENIAFVNADDGILALDRNNDGFINDGGELFGDQTILSNEQTATTGFQALADLDTNSDGKIDANDTEFENLKVIKADGTSATLDELGIKSLNLNYTDSNTEDSNGNTKLRLGSYTKTDDTTLEMSDYLLNKNNFYSIQKEWSELPEDIVALPEVMGRGNTYWLREAMVRDTSGELKTLVEQFIIETSPTNRYNLLDQILYKWVNSEDVNPDSRGSFDARKLGVIESFMGHDFRGSDTSIVNPEAVPFLDTNYFLIKEEVYAQLMSQSHLANLYSMLYVYDDVNLNLDGAIAEIQNQISVDAEVGKLLLREFSRSLMGLELTNYTETASFYNTFADMGTEYKLIMDTCNKIIVYGTENADSFDGTGNNEAFIGLGGDDYIHSRQGDDYIDGGSGNDTLNSCEGNDIVFGGEGNDSIIGGDGNDYLVGGAGADTIEGGAGNDVYVIDTDDIIIENANEGMDTVEVDFNYTLNIDNVENVTLAGTANINATGNDLDNVLTGNSGVNILTGGLGKDTYVMDSTDTIIESANEGNDTVVVDYNYTLNIDNVENVTLAGTADINATGDALDNVLTGNSGDNILDGAAGSDTLIGGGGNDTYIIDETDTIVENANAGIDTVVTDFSYALGTNLENLTLTGLDSLSGTGNDFNNYLTGNLGDNILTGNAGNDTLWGGEGNDSLSGVDGDDTYVFKLGDGLDTITDYYYQYGINRDGGNDTVKFEGLSIDDVNFKAENSNIIVEIKNTSDKLTIMTQSNSNFRIENYVFSDATLTYDEVIQRLVTNGTDNDDNIYGSDYNDRMYGFSGNDTLEGYQGNDSIYGGDGNDSLTGQDGNDYLEGNAGDDILRSDYGGNDTLWGGAGNDILEADQGDDTYVFKLGDGQDTIFDKYYQGSSYYDAGNDTVNFEGLSVNDINFRAENSTIIAEIKNTSDKLTINTQSNSNFRIENYVFSDATLTYDEVIQRLVTNGTDNDDNIYGSDYNDRIYGFGGDDTLQGYQGNDSIYSGDGNDSITGNDGNDSLEGYHGDDTYIFKLGDGQDTITDSYYQSSINYDAGNDTVKFEGLSTDDVTFRGENSNIIAEIINTSDKLTITNQSNSNFRIENYIFSDATLTYDEVIQRLITKGTDSSEQIYGSAGNDKIYGLGGDDTITGSSGNDSLYGGDGNDSLIGNDGNNYMQGDSGNDTLVGDYYSNDTLVGGAGDDLLKGAIGNNTYIFKTGDGQDTINEYYYTHNSNYDGGNDTVRFEGLSIDDVNFRAENSNIIAEIKNTSDKLTIMTQSNSNYVIENYVFSDATLTYNEVLQRLITNGTDSAEELYGSDYSEKIYGFGGNDTITGYQGNDSLYGGEGNDSLAGKEGNDYLAGGAGNDSLAGDSGNDTYVFAVGGGQDTINDNYYTYNAGVSDTLNFDNLSVNDVNFRAENSNIIAEIKNTSDQITLINQTNEINQIENYVFTDAALTYNDLLTRLVINGTDNAENISGSNYNEKIYGFDGNDTINALGGNDSIYGGDGNDYIDGGASNNYLQGDAGNDTLIGGTSLDTLVGGAGNDSLAGNYGNDNYVFAVGGGQDTINDNYYTYDAGANDTLNFDNLSVNDVNFRGSSTNIVAEIKSTTDNITLLNQYDPYQRIENFVFSDATLTYNDVLTRLTISGTDNDESLNGSYYFADKIYGNGGNDTISGGNSGSDSLYGGDGNDYLQGGYSNDYLQGDAGDDTLIGSSSNDILSGGAGNDSLAGETSSDTYIFALGGGNDTIYDYSGSQYSDGGTNDSLVFQDLSINDINFRSSNSFDIVAEIEGTTDNITLINQYDTYKSIENFVFSDGTLSYNDVLTRLTINGTDNSESLNGSAYFSEKIYGNVGNDTINGNGGNDSLYGGDGNDSIISTYGNDYLQGDAGNDTLIGSSGNDTYLFNVGDNVDTITDSSGSDLIKLGSNVNKNNVAFFKDSTNVYLDYGNSPGVDKVIVNSWSTTSNQIEQIQLNDGTYLTNTEINTIVQNMTAYATQHSITLTSVEDVKNSSELMSLYINNSWHN